jgi:TonB-linked SusC/RagA family outer membrane protein
MRLILFNCRLITLLLACLLLETIASSVHATPAGEGITIKKKNTPLEQIFQDIEKQSAYRFFYKVSLTARFKNVDIDVKDATIEETMRVILKNQSLSYEIVDKTIVITQKNEEVIPVQPSSPPLFVKGMVRNEENSPMAGVSVRLKGSLRGTTTNEKGIFELADVNAAEATLVISYIGYEEQEIKLNNRTGLSIVLKRIVREMEDVSVSVTTGYQTMLKGRATGSFTNLKGDEMNKIASTDFRERLEALVPGLQLGRNNNIIIRGQGTFSANRTPLVVVDGVPVEGAEYKLNPDDIEQISVLKDAAAASVWGIRSANGVIVITTKRGNRAGKTAISYNSFISIEAEPSLKKLRLLPADKYALGEWNKYFSFGTGLLQPYSFVTEIGQVYNDFKADQDTTRALNRIATIGAFDNSRQQEDLFYRSEIISNHTIALKTGDQNASHYFSVNYARTRFNQAGNTQDKFNFTSNSDFNIVKKIKLQFGTRGNYYNSVINAENTSGMKPYIRILDSSGNYVNEHKDISQYYKQLLQDSGWKDWSYNRLKEQRNNDYTSQSHTYAANLRLIYQPVTGLSYTFLTNYEKGFQKENTLHNEKSYYTRHHTNLFTENSNLLSPSIVKYHLPKNGGILSQGFYESNSFDLRNQLEYSTRFSNFHLHALAGTELYHYRASAGGNTFFGYNAQTLTHTDVDRSLLQKGVTGYNAVQAGSYLSQSFSSISEQVERYFSYYSTFSLNYMNRYDLFASARLDKTNLLVNANKYRNNPSWSAGARWTINKEKFFRSKAITSLSFKASYGVSGNIDKSTAPDITASAGTSRFGIPVLYITNPENKELGWEKTYVLNTGIEFSLWKDRIEGSFEYYHKNGKELLYTVSLDPTLGWGSIKKNAASILNTGVDLMLQAKPIVSKDFSWTSSLVFSYNYNKVRQVDYTPTQTDILGNGNPLVGKPINYLAAIRYMGISKTGDPMIRKDKGQDTLGAANLKDFTIDDYVFAGRKDPPFAGSFINSFQYKGWKLELFFTYKLGHSFLLPSFQNSIGNLAVNEWSDPELTWKKPGDENTKPYPRLTNGFYTTDVSYIVTHNHTLADKADLVRLRTVSLEYNLSKLVKQVPFKDVSIRLSAENIWYWAANKYKLDTDYIVPSTSSLSTVVSFPARSKFVLYLKCTLK